ncbi:DUF1453 domain-containing protein [Streptomyces sp. NPDC014734]|uniref:DUF1453 domain-containing protein n=1 Tax=Streptomyces sp. NPDC014734 TaxID=3364886 RepID=UPI00370057B3
MSGFVSILVIVAVVAVVLVRQCTARRISDDRRRWVLPGVLLVVSLRGPGPVDPHHGMLSVLFLGAELAVGLVTGAAWAWTSRLWHEADGSLWSRGTRASLFVWTGGLALRASLYGAAAALGIHQGTTVLMATLAVTLAVHSGVLMWRAGQLRPAYGGGPTGALSSQGAGKGRA